VGAVLVEGRQLLHRRQPGDEPTEAVDDVGHHGHEDRHGPAQPEPARPGPDGQGERAEHETEQAEVEHGGGDVAGGEVHADHRPLGDEGEAEECRQSQGPRHHGERLVDDDA
jgi:hypothetical protein